MSLILNTNIFKTKILIYVTNTHSLAAKHTHVRNATQKNTHILTYSLTRFYTVKIIIMISTNLIMGSPKPARWTHQFKNFRTLRNWICYRSTDFHKHDGFDLLLPLTLCLQRLMFLTCGPNMPKIKACKDETYCHSCWHVFFDHWF